MWLDRRFKSSVPPPLHDEDGIYFAHKPIYGFRMGRGLFGMQSAVLLVRLDELVCRMAIPCGAILFTILLKNHECYSTRWARRSQQRGSLAFGSPITGCSHLLSRAFG